MPREITHWWILEKTLKALDSDATPSVVTCLEQNKAAAYLGAMAHDVPYYYRFGEDHFSEVAGILHGKSGEDTFIPIRSISKRIVEKKCPEDRALCWAFLLGMISHLCADIVFHPMIFYFTGNYFDVDSNERRKAQARHRLMEVYLDSWLRPQVALWNSFSAQRVLGELGQKRLVLSELLEFGLAQDETLLAESNGVSRLSDKRKWYNGFSYMAWLQKAFFSNSAGVVARLLERASKGRLTHLDALFSWTRWSRSSVFDDALVYQNPVSGLDRQVGVEQLLDIAVVDCVELFSKFEPLLKGESVDVDGILGAVRGSSLNLGVYRATLESAKHYSPLGLSLPGLEKNS